MHRRVLRLVDALLYAVGLTVVFALVSAIVSFPAGAGWPGVKFGLFVLGLLAFGVAALELRPTPRWRDDPRFSLDTDDETWFQGLIQRVPPLRSNPLSPDERFSTGARLFLAGILTLATSFLMEAVLGVGVPPG
jgi:hypothetical protein